MLFVVIVCLLFLSFSNLAQSVQIGLYPVLNFVYFCIFFLYLCAPNGLNLVLHLEIIPLFTRWGEFCIGIPVKVGHSNFRLSGTSIVSISTCQPTKLGPSQTSGIMIVSTNLHNKQCYFSALIWDFVIFYSNEIPHDPELFCEK